MAKNGISPEIDGFSLKALGRVISQAFKPAWSYAPKRTTQSYYQAFHTSPRFDALDMLATDVASADYGLYPAKAYKQDPKNCEPIDEHQILKLLDNPTPDHPEMDGWMLRYATIVYRRMAGEAFWVLERDRVGRPIEAYIVPPTWVIQTPSTSYPYYMIQPSGNTSHKPLNIDPADVIWFKDVDVVNPYGRGRGRDESIGDEIEADEYASKYGKNFFYNDATPPIAIEAPGATMDQVEKAKESWTQKVGGWLNARKPAFLTWKDAKIHKLADSPREMDFVESRKFLRDVCNQHYGLPPELMGILENSNRSTIDNADYLWTKGSVSRELKRYYAVLNRQLVPQYKDDVILVPENIIPEDKNTQIEQLFKGVEKGVVTRDEIRAALGLSPDPKHGAVYLMPMSTVEQPIDGEKEEPPEMEASDEAREEEDFGEVDEEGEGESAEGQDELMGKAFDPDKAKAYWKSFDTKAASGEEPFKTAVGKYANKKEKELRESFKAHVKNGLPFDKALDAAIEDVYGADADKMLKDNLAPAWVMSMKHGVELAEELLGAAINFDLLNPTFVKWVETVGLERAKLVNDTTREALKKTLADGIAEGEGIQKLARRLAEVQNDLAGYRAERIARTETIVASNAGSFYAYKQEGVQSLEWISTMDSRVRDAHAGANGQIIPIDGLFDVGGEHLQYPGDSTHGASASNTIQCRCAIAAVIK